MAEGRAARLAVAVAAPASLLLLVVALAWPDLGRPVHNTIEAIRIACAQSMVAGGHWLVPRTWGEPYIFKPPGLPWVIALAGLAAGRVDERLARLAVALFSGGLTALLWALSRRPLGDRRAWLACLILVSGYDFAHRAAYALIDLPLMLALGAAAWAFHRGLLEPEGERRWFAATHALGALAALLKGPLALAVLAAAVLPMAAAGGRPRAAWRLLARPATLLWLLPAAWYGAVLAGGGEAARSLLSTELTQQITGRNEQEPVTYYLGSLASHFLPWGWLLPLTAAAAWRRHRRLALTLAAWAAATFLLFSLAEEKTHRYLMPLYP
ncbi:MAG: phospholipid carrier-dependent glycosyltransferase, partial [Nitrospirae bacterium]